MPLAGFVMALKPYSGSIQNCSLQWRHNDHDSVSNHQPHGCLLNRLFRRRSKYTSKLRVTGLCVGNSPGPVNSPHKGPVMRKIFPLMTSSCEMCWTYAVKHLEGSSSVDIDPRKVGALFLLLPCSIWRVQMISWSPKTYRKISNIRHTKSQMFLTLACRCLCAIYWSQVLRGEWKCSWSSADRRCSNYIWVINNLIAY